MIFSGHVCMQYAPTWQLGGMRILKSPSSPSGRKANTHEAKEHNNPCRSPAVADSITYENTMPCQAKTFARQKHTSSLPFYEEALRDKPIVLCLCIVLLFYKFFRYRPNSFIIALITFILIFEASALS